MYTTVNGIYEKGQITLEEMPPTNQKMRVLVTFVEETLVQTPAQTTKPTLGFAERWQGQFKNNVETDDARLAYLKQRYQL